MAGSKGNSNPPLRDRDLRGLAMLRPLLDVIDVVHGVGTERDRAGNRRLFMDQYVVLLLLFMFNPICSSLRAVQRASELPKVRKRLGVGRVSLGSLSEAAGVFEAEALEPILDALIARVGPLPKYQRYAELGATIRLVDGSRLSALGGLAVALWGDENKPGVKLHLSYDLTRSVPVGADLTDVNGDERAHLESILEPGMLYVIDRGYQKYELLQKVLDAGSGFVCRVREDMVVREVIETRPLGQADRAAGVLDDRVVLAGADGELSRPVRRVTLACRPNRRLGGKKRASGGRSGPSQSDRLYVLCDRLDLPAETIAMLYHDRWQVELFFRFFKHVLGCRHLISHDPNGVQLQVYAAIIACLLIALRTGRKPTKATVELVAWMSVGLADAEDLADHLRRLKVQTERA